MKVESIRIFSLNYFGNLVGVNPVDHSYASARITLSGAGELMGKAGGASVDVRLPLTEQEFEALTNLIADIELRVLESDK